MMENIENNKKSTLTVYDDGDKYWHKNDQVHREDGPAVEYDNGDKLWYLNNKLHREDGPAVEFANGHKNCREMGPVGNRRCRD